MQNEDYARACPMLAQSQRLDPGIGTQFNLADCYEHVGKTASAWALFLEVESETKANGETARASAAHSRAEALAPKLSHVVIAVPTTHARGLVVKKDGAVVGAMQWGIALPIDPGPHTIRVSAPGRKPWESTLVVLPDGLTVALPIPDLPSNDGSAVEEPAPSDAAGDGEPSDVEPRPASAKHEGGLGGQALAGIALGGVGALGIVVGTMPAPSRSPSTTPPRTAARTTSARRRPAPSERGLSTPATGRPPRSASASSPAPPGSSSGSPSQATRPPRRVTKSPSAWCRSSAAERSAAGSSRASDDERAPSRGRAVPRVRKG